MKTKLILFIVLLLSIVHVHMNMFITENFANPSFWVALILESPPFGGSGCRMLSNILIMGIQCVVTSLVASEILKWRNIKRWLFSYFICIIAFVLLWFFLDIHNNVTIVQAYDRIYGYGGAFKYCLTYSIIQILYILLYTIISQSNNNGYKTTNNKP